MTNDPPAKIYLSYDGYGKTITVGLYGDACWPELFDEFRNFLNGIGFSVPCGSWEPEEDDDDEQNDL